MGRGRGAGHRGQGEELKLPLFPLLPAPPAPPLPTPHSLLPPLQHDRNCEPEAQNEHD